MVLINKHTKLSSRQAINCAELNLCSRFCCSVTKIVMLAWRLVVTCWERADLLALVCGVCFEFVTFPLVSWVRCGTWLYSLAWCLIVWCPVIISKSQFLRVTLLKVIVLYRKKWWKYRLKVYLTSFTVCSGALKITSQLKKKRKEKKLWKNDQSTEKKRRKSSENDQSTETKEKKLWKKLWKWPISS